MKVISLVFFYVLIVTTTANNNYYNNNNNNNNNNNYYYNTPEQVHLSYTGKTNEMMVMWVSKSTSDPSIVYYGLNSNNLDRRVTGTASTFTDKDGYNPGGIHTAVFTDLEPATLYYYNVIGSSIIGNFTSAPKLGTQGVIFGVIGDVGADSDSAKTVAGLVDMRAKEGLDIVIHAGDLSYANDFPNGGPLWDKYGQILESLASTTPYNPSVGNHEKQDHFGAFKVRYNTERLEKNSGGGKFWWSFDFGNVHTIMLSSETPHHTNSEQYYWLLNDLQSVNRSLTPWIIACWHTPWYNSNTEHQLEGEKMRLAMEPLFHRFSVDIGIVGHVHAYERTGPVYNFKPTQSATTYITVGNGGTPEGLYHNWLDQPDWSLARYSVWGYSRLVFVNETHAHWSMREDTSEDLLDETWIVRQQS